MHDELAQYRVCRELFDAWYAAVYHTAHGAFSIESAKWITEYTERRRGAAIEVVGAVDAVLADSDPTFAPADTTALAVVSEFDVSDPAVEIAPE